MLLRRKIDYHEFQDGLRRMDTEFPVTFTTEDWNTLIVSRGFVMTNGMLDLQVCPAYRSFAVQRVSCDVNQGCALLKR